MTTPNAAVAHDAKAAEIVQAAAGMPGNWENLPKALAVRATEEVAAGKPDILSRLSELAPGPLKKVMQDAYQLARKKPLLTHASEAKNVVSLDHARLSKQGQAVVGVEHLSAALGNHHAAEQGGTKFRPSQVEKLRKRAAKAASTESKSSAKHGGKHAEGLTPHHVNQGLCFLGAGLLAVGAYSSFSTAFSKDAEGDSRPHGTHLAIGVIEAVMAAGMLYLGTTMHTGKGR